MSSRWRNIFIVADLVPVAQWSRPKPSSYSLARYGSFPERCDSLRELLQLKLQLQPVVRQAHIRWQRRIGLLMRQIVRDVREEGALRLAAAPPASVNCSTVECVG